MKVKVYLNRIQVDVKADFIRAEEYFKKRGVNFTFSFENSDYKNPTPEVFPLNVGFRILLPTTTADLFPLDPANDLTIFVFNQEEFSAKLTPTGRYYPYKGTHVAHVGTHRVNPKDLTYVEICHEIMHFLTAKANQKGFIIPDQMDTYWNNFFLETENSNFGQQWKLLKPFIDSLKPVVGWKYFTLNEVKGLKTELVDMLDNARGLAGVPFIITSGYRTEAQNRAVGGVQDSAHETGLAVDLKIKDGVTGEKINAALHKVGFQRFGYYRDNHIHVDIDLSKPHPCYWIK